MNENENKKQGLELELSPEIGLGEYVNFAIITHSSSDFVIDFARVLPGLPKSVVRSRVIMGESVNQHHDMPLPDMYPDDMDVDDMDVPCDDLDSH